MHAKISLFALTATVLLSFSAHAQRFSPAQMAQYSKTDAAVPGQALVNEGFTAADAIKSRPNYVAEYGSDYKFGSEGIGHIYLGRKFETADMQVLVDIITQFDRYSEIVDRKGDFLFYEMAAVDNFGENPVLKTYNLLDPKTVPLEGKIPVALPVLGNSPTTYKSNVVLEISRGVLAVEMNNSEDVVVKVGFIQKLAIVKNHFRVRFEFYPTDTGLLMYAAVQAKPEVDDPSITADFFARYAVAPADWIEMQLRERLQ